MSHPVSPTSRMFAEKRIAADKARDIAFREQWIALSAEFHTVRENELIGLAVGHFYRQLVNSRQKFQMRLIRTKSHNRLWNAPQDKQFTPRLAHADPEKLAQELDGLKLQRYQTPGFIKGRLEEHANSNGATGLTSLTQRIAVRIAHPIAPITDTWAERLAARNAPKPTSADFAGVAVTKLPPANAQNIKPYDPAAKMHTYGITIRKGQNEADLLRSCLK